MGSQWSVGLIDKSQKPTYDVWKSCWIEFESSPLNHPPLPLKPICTILPCCTLCLEYTRSLTPRGTILSGGSAPDSVRNSNVVMFEELQTQRSVIVFFGMFSRQQSRKLDARLGDPLLQKTMLMWSFSLKCLVFYRKLNTRRSDPLL